jgi:hypothetical protein
VIDFHELSKILATPDKQMIRFALQSERLGPLPLVNHFIHHLQRQVLRLLAVPEHAFSS